MPNKADCSKCKATTQNGQRCKLNTCKGEFCWRHLKSQDHLRVKRSGIHGFGLYASKPRKKSNDIVFRKNQKIIQYKGEVIDPEEKERRAKQGKDEYMADLSKGWVVDANKTNSGAARFANDCRGTKKPCNASLRRGQPKKNKHEEKVWLKSKKNIRDDQEILVSYGPGYWGPKQRGKRKKTTK